MKERMGIERKKKLLMRMEKKMEKKINNSRVLQLIAQIGKILSKVAFVFSIIGICGRFVGLLYVLGRLYLQNLRNFIFIMH